MSEDAKIRWVRLPDYHDKEDIVVHEVKCPKCNYHETYLGCRVPTACFICEERRYL